LTNDRESNSTVLPELWALATANIGHPQFGSTGPRMDLAVPLLRVRMAAPTIRWTSGFVAGSRKIHREVGHSWRNCHIASVRPEPVRSTPFPGAAVGGPWGRSAPRWIVHWPAWARSLSFSTS